jgi:hypothetical protein
MGNAEAHPSKQHLSSMLRHFYKLAGLRFWLSHTMLGTSTVLSHLFCRRRKRTQVKSFEQCLAHSKSWIHTSYYYYYEPNCNMRTHLMQHAAVA